MTLSDGSSPHIAPSVPAVQLAVAIRTTIALARRGGRHLRCRVPTRSCLGRLCNRRALSLRRCLRRRRFAIWVPMAETQAATDEDNSRWAWTWATRAFAFSSTPSTASAPAIQRLGGSSIGNHQGCFKLVVLFGGRASWARPFDGSPGSILYFKKIWSRRPDSNRRPAVTNQKARIELAILAFHVFVTRPLSAVKSMGLATELAAETEPKMGLAAPLISHLAGASRSQR
jgi:hypothetical protein